MKTIGHNSILVGVDGSPTSNAALDWAVAEATRRKLPLHLFSAGLRQVPGGEAMYYAPELAAEITREATAAADAHLTAARTRTRDLAPELAVTLERGLDYAAGPLVERSSDADTVVVGHSSHGPGRAPCSARSRCRWSPTPSVPSSSSVRRRRRRARPEGLWSASTGPSSPSSHWATPSTRRHCARCP